MKRPTDARIYAVFEEFERQRVTAGRMDTGESIIATARELGITYADVQRVVVSKLAMGFSG